MLIKQLSVFVENRAGALAEACRVLRDNNLNISTLSLADTQEFGILRLLIGDYEKAANVLKQAGFVAKITDVLALTVPNRPGGMAEVLEILNRHQLTIEYMYAFSGECNSDAILVFRFTDPQKAAELLKNEPIQIVGPERLFR